ncbi:AAA family ATPase, partial [Bergeyella sp. RCAD1439]|uniref:AAA family ATPase n=1 Tax=Bergeyella anatis TaxID=3113737 RepID=UPI002E17D7D7|nr:AAA family ATPase [Bergeyella sp. RCAD1439]
LEKHLVQCESVAKEKRTHITDWDLALVVSQKTNIPLGKLQEDEKERLSNMEATLAKRVVGQDHAISIVTEAVLENRSGLSKAGQPIGSFFFLGPTGTGKTELAKSLASFLFQDENAIIRFDMSEFKEEHAAALLYGAPPGYVGYEEGGLLVNKIRQKPYSIVLFDEIEKAHASVFDVFLQIMD